METKTPTPEALTIIGEALDALANVHALETPGEAKTPTPKVSAIEKNSLQTLQEKLEAFQDIPMAQIKAIKERLVEIAISGGSSVAIRAADLLTKRLWGAPPTTVNVATPVDSNAAAAKLSALFGLDQVPQVKQEEKPCSQSSSAPSKPENTTTEPSKTA